MCNSTQRKATSSTCYEAQKQVSVAFHLLTTGVKLAQVKLWLKVEQLNINR